MRRNTNGFEGYASHRIGVRRAGDEALDTLAAAGRFGTGERGADAAGAKLHDGATDALAWAVGFGETDAVVFDIRS